MADPADQAILPNWRIEGDYAYSKLLSRRGWAWEFLRRNPDFQRAHSAALKLSQAKVIGPSVTLIEVSTSSNIGRHFFASSLRSDAAVFWDLESDPAVFPVWVSNNAIEGNDSFDLGSLGCRVTILQDRAGGQQVLLQGEGFDLQLVVKSGDMLQESHLRMDLIAPPNQLAHRLWALECLNRIRWNERLPDRLFPPHPRRDRLSFVVRALDGALDQAPHQEIASALLGEHRVRLDWGDPGNHLRDRIRRAIKRGRALMNGGYLGFLK